MAEVLHLEKKDYDRLGIVMFLNDDCAFYILIDHILLTFDNND